MDGMRLGGIDPSIIRELSGVYKPFAKAFKELVSNAFDADADNVLIEFADDFSSVTISDDGCGMTPLDFRNDFTRIGGGSRRWTGDRTKRGRLRIGSKGIGFLALARYCERLRVESGRDRPVSTRISIPSTPATVDVADALGVPMPSNVLDQRLSITVSAATGRKQRLVAGRDYKWQAKQQRLIISKKAGAVNVELKVDCRGLRFAALLDFDKLVRLADNADLEKLDDFASIDVFAAETAKRERRTHIIAEGFRPFFRKDLRSERRTGLVRNIGSFGGYEQFLWSLSRCTPVAYKAPTDNDLVSAVLPLIAIEKQQQTLGRLEVVHAKKVQSIERPIYPLEPDAPKLEKDMLVAVEIHEKGLKAVGFLAGYESVIFPAEYRGISIRVRGVAIGEPGFLGAESLLTGASKAALSQITGEINVVAGLDAVDTLNPGRESFYEESEQFKVLRRHMIGDGERVGGYVNRAVSAVIRRSQVRSALGDVLGRAALRRRALDDISAAITKLVSHGDDASRAIKKMLSSKRAELNGLSSAPTFEFALPPRIGGMQLVAKEQLGAPSNVDYEAERVMLDTTTRDWCWSLLLFDREFEVLHKRGLPEHPIAEVDFKRATILVNWGHAAKLQMDDHSFLRMALAFVIAKEAGRSDSRLAMDLAIRLLSFAGSVNG
ncbi:MAG TPA: ATP-binding protein [Pirellulales bacterium]|nr:ATP-binding protein [Pirellulales bacterium]